MQKPNIILGILNSRSQNNLTIDHVYKYMYNSFFYIEAYNSLLNNESDNIDDSIIKRINKIIEEIKLQKYNWNNLYKTTKNRGFKQSSLPEWRDKLVQEVLRMILSAIYEPKFTKLSYNLLINKNCAIALNELYIKGKSCEFFIDFDISDCFTSIDHDILLNILKRDIKDGRFIEFIRKYLKTGRLEHNIKYDKTFSGTPICDNLTTLFINIYLNELDHFLESNYILKWNIDKKRPSNPEYRRLSHHIDDREKTIKNNPNKDHTERIQQLKELRKQRQTLKSVEQLSKCNYRRFSYIRYMHRLVIPFTGIYKEAVNIKKTNLKLMINNSAKVIKSSNEKNPLNFLGYNVITQWDNTYKSNNKRTLSGTIALMIPDKVITNYILRYTKKHKPIHRPELLNESIYDIIYTFQSEYERICQYYIFARNKKLLNKLKMFIEISLTKTLAAKLKISVHKIYKKFGSTKQINDYTYKVLKETIIDKNKKTYEIYFGAIPLKKVKINSNYILNDLMNLYSFPLRYNRIQKILYRKCEICGSKENLIVHHVNHLKNILNQINTWKFNRSVKKRKTIVICHNCHTKIHNGTFNNNCGIK